MKWNVYHYDINANKIKTFNIFDHYSFREYVKQAAKKYKYRETFEDQLKRELMYYFWCKSEYELVIEITEDNRIFLIPWCGCRNPEEVKIEPLPIITEEGYDWMEFAELHIKRQIYGNKAKIDIYDQVMFSWNRFVNYVWDNRKELLKDKS